MSLRKKFKERLDASLKKAEELTDKLVAKLSIQDLDEDPSAESDYVSSANLRTPKRLFDTKTMKTVMYEDAVDVEKEGYVAISHVWGFQRKYVPKGVGVMGGVTWSIPLSDPGKILRVMDAMSQYKERYCWFDVLCLPQDKQDEINEEIPFMGDYYAGADIVLVLATVDPVISEEFTKWYDIMADVVKEERDFTKEERDWLDSHRELDLLDMSGEKWLTRLWTFQEAIMAKKLVLVCSDGKHVDLFDVAEKMDEMDAMGDFVDDLFETSGDSVTNILKGKLNRLDNKLDLVWAMSECSKRDCFKPQDKFYGAFGALGYKDFPVDYEINMEDLNKAIVRHAFSKGDLSWLSVGGDEGTGFIQPMYKPFTRVGWTWKEDIPDICGVRLEGEIMHINAWSFAKVVCHEKVILVDGNYSKFRGDMYKIFKNWELDDKDIAKNMVGHEAMSNDEAEIAVEVLKGDARGDETYDNVHNKFGFDAADEDMISVIDKVGIEQDIEELTIVKVTTWENKNIPLSIIGNAEIGDQIMLVRMTDGDDKVLGIVVDKYFRRKGVCLYEKIEMTEEEAISRYVPQEFPL